MIHLVWMLPSLRWIIPTIAMIWLIHLLVELIPLVKSITIIGHLWLPMRGSRIIIGLLLSLVEVLVLEPTILLVMLASHEVLTILISTWSHWPSRINNMRIVVSFKLLLWKLLLLNHLISRLVSDLVISLLIYLLNLITNLIIHIVMHLPMAAFQHLGVDMLIRVLTIGWILATWDIIKSLRHIFDLSALTLVLLMISIIIILIVSVVDLISVSESIDLVLIFSLI